MIGALYSKTRFCCAACAVALVLTLTAMPSRGAVATSQTGGVLRLHIVANSDTAADQRVKLLVRDEMLKLIPAAASCAEAEAYVLSHGRELLQAAEDTLRENGMGYGAQLLLGTSAFPDRAYEGKLFPAGEYRALRVVLGSGAGQNWWCVLFPPLCIVTGEEQPMPDLDEIEFTSSIASCIRRWRDAR